MDDLDGVPGTVDALQQLTRVLVGVAVRGLDELPGEVSVAQFRLLLALSDEGPCTGTGAAAVLGALPSTVTRLADHLERSGHLTRSREPANRSVVTLRLTAAGAGVVERVLAFRHAELTRMAATLGPRERACLKDAVHAVVRSAGGVYGAPAALLHVDQVPL